jgi:16S rRNA processing protein RimM
LTNIPTKDLVQLGEVSRPHGLEGLLRIWSYAQSEDSFLRAGTVFLNMDQKEPQEYKVLSVKRHKNILLMQLEGLTSRYEAERFRGAGVFIKKETLQREDEDDYFWFELIGLNVYLDTGKHIGTLEDIIPTNSNDIYIVRQEDKEYLIPATHDMVKEIDLVKKCMIVMEREGLLDIN